MKGIFMSVTLTITMMSIMIGLIWMVTFEQHRFMLHKALKVGLRSTMQTCIDLRCNQSLAMDLFEQYFINGLSTVDELEWHLMGFIQQPLMMRIQVVAKHGHGWFQYHFLMDEAMIEEEGYE